MAPQSYCPSCLVLHFTPAHSDMLHNLEQTALFPFVFVLVLGYAAM